MIMGLVRILFRTRDPSDTMYDIKDQINNSPDLIMESRMSDSYLMEYDTDR